MTSDSPSLGKRLLKSSATQTLTGAFLRFYRPFVLGTMLFEHDPALTRFLQSGQPAIFAVWHQDFVLTLGYLSNWNPVRRVYALASASRDGGIASAAAEGMGFRTPIRGSTARGGKRALLALTRLLRDEPDASLAVVVDGPRPPAREMKPGIVHLASHSGLPVWLLRTSTSPERIAKRSWARFHLPLPFCRAVIRADGPIDVPRDLDRAGVEAWRLELERRLNGLADAADRRVRVLGSR